MSDQPKSPDHFGAFESDHPAEPERAITPFHKFDSSSKFAAAKSVDPLAGVARLFPRDPKSPSEFERLRIERAAMPTDPSPPPGPDDTPIRHVLSPMDQLCLDVSEMRDQFKDFQRGFSEVKTHCRDAANNSIQMLSSVEKLTGKVESLDKRMTAIELSERWIPRLAWLVTFLIAVFALSRTYR